MPAQFGSWDVRVRVCVGFRCIARSRSPTSERPQQRLLACCRIVRLIRLLPPGRLRALRIGCVETCRFGDLDRLAPKSRHLTYAPNQFLTNNLDRKGTGLWNGAMPQGEIDLTGQHDPIDAFKARRRAAAIELARLFVEEGYGQRLRELQLRDEPAWLPSDLAVLTVMLRHAPRLEALEVFFR